MGFDQSSDNDKKSKCSLQRNYGCPCGKTYLSYPALFTHVKQKHGGKPPGQLIKPKNEKTRGRPRINSITNQSDGQQSIFDIQQELSKALNNVKISHQCLFTTSQGKKSCNDMMSQFLASYQCSQDQKNILVCFISYFKFYIDQKYGQNYWINEHPSEIIDLANEIVKNFNQHSSRFPIQKKLLIDLIFILFKWMYKNKWTDHKLIKKISDSSTMC